MASPMPSVSYPPAYHPYYVPAPPPPRRSHRSSCSCSRICCCFCFFLLFLLFLASVAISAFIAWLSPSLPSLRLAHLAVANLSFAARPARLSSSLDLTLSIRNHNRAIRFDYGRIYVRVQDEDDVVLAVGSAKGFFQRKKNTTNVRLAAAVENLAVGEEEGEEVEEKYNEGKLEVDVLVMTELHAMVKGWHSAGFEMAWLCKRVEVSKDGSLGDDGHKCFILVNYKKKDWMGRMVMHA